MNGGKPTYDSKEGQELVSAFCVHAGWIESIFSMYAELYYFDDALQLIDTQNEYWYHLNGKALVLCILLEFSKVTDPKDSGVDKDNLSVNFIVDSIEWPAETSKKLNNLRTRMNEFGQYIILARHKLLAHLSVEAAKTRKRYGEFPIGKDREFVADLQAFCKLAYEAAFLNKWGIRYSGMSRRADMVYFKTSLAKSRAFDALMSLVPVETRTKMRALLQEQFRTPLRPATWDYLRQPESESS